MIVSRDVNELLPTVRQMCGHFMHECMKHEIDVVITCTFRDAQAQKHLYDHGRTIPGKLRTENPPGWSWHQWRCAFDVVVLYQGKPISGSVSEENEMDNMIWQKIGEIAKIAGLEWGGTFQDASRELGHFQYTYGRSLRDVNSGAQRDSLPESLHGAARMFKESANGRTDRPWWIPGKIASLLSRRDHR